MEIPSKSGNSNQKWKFEVKMKIQNSNQKNENSNQKWKFQAKMKIQSKSGNSKETWKFQEYVKTPRKRGNSQKCKFQEKDEMPRIKTLFSITYSQKTSPNPTKKTILKHRSKIRDRAGPYRGPACRPCWISTFIFEKSSFSNFLTLSFCSLLA